MYVQIEYLSRVHNKGNFEKVPGHNFFKLSLMIEKSEMEKEEKEKKTIRQYQRNGWMDLSELRDIDSLHIEGTDTLVKGSLGWKGWFIEA